MLFNLEDKNAILVKILEFESSLQNKCGKAITIPE